MVTQDNKGGGEPGKIFVKMVYNPKRVEEAPKVAKSNALTFTQDETEVKKREPKVIAEVLEDPEPPSRPAASGGDKPAKSGSKSGKKHGKTEKKDKKKKEKGQKAIVVEEDETVREYFGI
jgi:hypothetical protein